MYLTRFSDIGLRILIYLTHGNTADTTNITDRTGAPPITVAEIAKQFDLSTHHVVKVVGELSRAGWIHTTRGRQGGIRLAVDPASLQIGKVLRVLEGDAELIDCKGLHCQLQHACVFRGALQAGLRAFYTAMDAYTLRDLGSGKTAEHIVQMHKNFRHAEPA